ncbi:MAG: DUF5009 domain-containing protein, partial [candidate division KSB1 bacterium]|nr:DUF5009 domain-containing protein [candidate division KSB1 bacterium]
GTPLPKIIISILERGFLLAFFAIFLRHVRPHVLNPHPDVRSWVIAIVGFLVMFAVFTRLPATWLNWQRLTIHGLGWLAAVGLLAILRYPNDQAFSLTRSDIIIVVLANMAVFGSLVWLCTRNRLLMRLSLLGLLLGFRLANPEPGWVHWLWNFSPAPWIYKLYYLQYLFIVIPGTIVGDLLLTWMKQTDSESGATANWSAHRLIGISTLMIGFLVICLVGLQARWLWQTALAGFLFGGIGWWLLSNPSSHAESLLHSIFKWGIYWFILGLVFEAFEGGIKKDHPTLSYYFITTGLSIFLLMALTIVIDVFKKKRWLQILIDNGQNPMIAYVGFANFIWPILALTGLEKLILSMTSTPWLGFLRALIYTFLLALVVSFFTRKKIFWRT